LPRGSYVAVERHEMLRRCDTDAVWVRFRGVLTQNGISSLLQKHFCRRFGRAHGAHFFRYCLATTAAIEATNHPLDGAVLLGHASPQTTLKHYNRAQATGAALRHAERIRALRRITQGYSR
jgi:integrase